VAVIDPNGLFNGDRLRRCSNAAQLHWVRLFLASDGFGRLEINYARIVGRAYVTFNPIPSETELQSFIQEYVKNYLLFLYEVAGQLWGQWDTRSELLPRYKTSSDRRSPIPPEPAFTRWKQRYREEQKAFPKSFGKISAGFLHGVGVGEGVGNTNTRSSCDERTRTLCSVDDPPFSTLDEEPVAGKNGNGPQAEAGVWGVKEKRRAFVEGFWPVWPRKVSRAAGEKAWLKHAGSPEAADKIIQAVKAQLSLLTADPKYCPYPATWLNDQRYEDDPDEIAAASRPGAAAPDSSQANASNLPEWTPPAAWEDTHG